MNRSIMISIILSAFIGFSAFAEEPMHTQEFQKSGGLRSVRTYTPVNGFDENSLARKLPVRNSTLLSEIMYVDRMHENAVANNVAISPDGSDIIAGWWLNNERFSRYVSAGMQWPAWDYRITTDWEMPVSSSNSRFAGTEGSIPCFVWDHNSPLYTEDFAFDGHVNQDVDFSGDGSLVAVAASNSNECLVSIYDMDSEEMAASITFPLTSSFYGVDLSSDGSRVLVTLYNSLEVYSVPAGEYLGSLYNYSQTKAKISGDGTYIVSGTFSGSFYIFEWDGDSYEYALIAPTGDDWVTSVAISDDGSTAACGTLDFEGSNIGGGKFILWDVATATVLIDYDEFGDEVSSVALSNDGMYAIAGSWGKYDATFGDVVTGFIRNTDIPIFQILDDIDEPGSVFSVDISASGNFAVASGKAVHARAFGNGGMVYSIMLKDPVDHDVAVASIDEPGEMVIPGESFTPSATFINVGNEGVGFDANCYIINTETDEIIYTSTFNIDYLGSFMTSSVFFQPDFAIPEDGRYRLLFEADYDADENIDNNSLDLILRSWHDISAELAPAPFDEVTVGWSMVPVGAFSNLGTYYETFEVEAAIYDAQESIVYNTTSTIYNLNPYGSEEVMFAGWTPSETGQYKIEYTANHPDDIDQGNDSFEKWFEVVNEMMYDDGYSDGSYWVGSYPSSTNRIFAQKFDINVTAPYTINNVRFFLPNSSFDGTFDYLGIAKDSFGTPDTTQFLAYIDNPQLSQPGSWTAIDIDSSPNDGSPLWMLLHWADQQGNGPFIGADNTGVIDQHSYWHANENGWNLWMSADWMMRMTAQTSTGIETDYISGLPTEFAMLANYPNPFNSSTNITFTIPSPAKVRLEIYNSLGQKVTTLKDEHFEAGYHTVTFNGHDEKNAELASGIYYCKLTSGSQSISQKIVMIK